MKTKTKKLRSSPTALAYPGTRQLRFRAALAGARLVRIMQARHSSPDFVGDACRLDRLDFSSDCAEWSLEALAEASGKALEAVRAYRAARTRFFDQAASQARSRRASVRHGRAEGVA